MTIQDTSKIREKIISIFKNKGPCLPINIAKETGLNTLFASAFLSEFIAEKKIKVSHMKVGSSPLYFIPGQENMLEKFSEYLKSKEKEAFLLLKKNNFLKDSQQQPAIRVALRSIKDFAIPFKQNEEIYWRYFTTPEKNLEVVKKETTKIEIEKIKPEILANNEETKPNKKSKRRIAKRKNKSQKNDKFFGKIKDFLSKKSINIINIEGISKNEMALKIESNGKEQLLIAYNKKRIGGKVKTKTIAYLGKDRGEAEKRKEEILNKSNKEKNSHKMKEKANIPILEKVKISTEDLASFCKRKGFVYQSGDIYGGFAGFWDFGNLGTELKNNIKNSWWNYNVHQREDVVGVDGSIITHPQVWIASGHVDRFSDVSVECKKCKKTGKVDRTELGKAHCENCGGKYDTETAKEIKLMFSAGQSYLRPETAQLIFTNFKYVYENARAKLPFGIAQIGKAFRNEISPRDFLFRSREFEQMELQYFIDPGKVDDCQYYDKIKNFKIKILTAKNQEEELLKISEMIDKKIFKNKWHAYWLYNSYNWFLSLGIKKDNLRLREHKKDELSHYANAAIDIEYPFPNGWGEIFGSHDRGQFDLKEHEKFSNEDLKVFDEETKKKILPLVIESSFGVERAFLAFMFDSYFQYAEKKNVVLRLHPKLSPIKAAIFPIVKKPKFEKISRNVFNDLKDSFNVVYDNSGSVGRRYARNDEIGTPYCITIDGDSIENKDVTIRNRDNSKQIRVKIKELKEIFRNLIEGKIKFEEVGRKI